MIGPHRRGPEVDKQTGRFKKETRSDREIIEEFSVPVTESGCWLWLGGYTGKRMLPRFMKDGVHINACRASYEAFKGPIPEGMFACHKCDTPQCVNPDHLFAGTPKDNTHDMIRKGRNRRTLTETIVKEIRASPDVRWEVWAEKFNVQRCCIRKVQRGLTWSHVE